MTASGQKRPLNGLYQNSGIYLLTGLGLGFLRNFGTVRIADMIDWRPERQRVSTSPMHPGN